MQASEGAKSRRDLLAGPIFIVIAAGFAFKASNDEMGRGIRMEPGFIRLTLDLLLAAFGLLIVLASLKKDDQIETTPIPRKASS